MAGARWLSPKLAVIRAVLPARRPPPADRLPAFLVQEKVVALEGQHVVGVRLLDLTGDVLLCVERVDGDGQPTSSNWRNSKGMAVISLLFSAVCS